MTNGEIWYLALVGAAALAFILALAYASTVSGKGPK